VTWQGVGRLGAGDARLAEWRQDLFGHASRSALDTRGHGGSDGTCGSIHGQTARERLSPVHRREYQTMITLFTIPKAFKGHTALVQRNAIRSWTQLSPRPEIILFGTDEGTEDAAREFGVRHVAEVGRNELGTPLVSSLFESGERLSTTATLCYINADIILLGDFISAVNRIPKGRFSWQVGDGMWTSRQRSCSTPDGPIDSNSL